jgi:AraC-like DNA-binding protein
MNKQSIFPYYTELLDGVDGVDLLSIEGASMVHFADRGGDYSEALAPCRVDALVMVVCVRGNVSFTLHSRDYTVEANQFFVASTSVLQLQKVADSEFYMLVFSSDFLMGANIDVGFIARLVSQFRVNAYIAPLAQSELRGVCRLFETLHEAYMSSKRSEYMNFSLRHVYCAMIYRIADSLLDVKDVPSVGVKDRSSEYFERLIKLLAENYREHRNVEFYATQMCISSKHLSRVIRNFTGKSVHQWIDEFVALEIKNMLRHSKLSIQQISNELNFPNPSFMGQYFKRITGLTPGEYKKSAF